jgi:mono/diheme cytochrome c family protein
MQENYKLRRGRERREQFAWGEALRYFKLGEDSMAWRSAILCAFLSWGLIGCKAKSAADIKIPQEEVDRKNPIDSNLASIAEGKRLYGATDCALCHGKDGDGKGVEAKDINMNLHDWRKSDSIAHFTDGELSFLILKGKGRMPAYDGRETPEQVWGIIIYIRSMSTTGEVPKS